MSSISMAKLTRELTVKKRIDETSEAVSFVFEIPDSLKKDFTYTAGQFVTLFLNINGEELRRSYSLSSCPKAGDDFQITVKRVQGGRGSNYLCDKVFAGDILHVTPPSGFFFEEADAGQARHYFLFAAGSGVTPVFSILKHVLLSNDQNKVSFLFANRSQSQIIYSKLLDDWQSRYASRLNITHILSQPTSPWEGPSGRCTEILVKNFVLTQKIDSQLSPEVYICGPAEFMSLIKSSLQAVPLPDEAIHIESFGDGPAPVLEASHFDESGKVVIGEPLKPGEKPRTLNTLLNGEEISLQVNENLSLLENLIEQGHNPPYSCMDGSCMACMAKLKKGRIYQDDAGILTEENIQACEILTCQARPLSEIVEIDFDSL